MKCHEVDFEIIGDDMQIVEIELDPQETVIAEAGAMNYLQPEVTFETKMGDGAKPEKGVMDKIFSAGKSYRECLQLFFSVTAPSEFIISVLFFPKLSILSTKLPSTTSSKPSWSM